MSNTISPSPVATPSKTFSSSQIYVSLLICFVIVTGILLIPYAGIQQDEALFAHPYYHRVVREFRLRMFHTDIPLMVMTYIGTLKSYLCWPGFLIFGSQPNLVVWATRLPVVCVSAVTVWIFFYLAARASGRSAAFLASALLATDPTFLLTNTFDWGPVALEHLLLVSGCFFLLKYAQNARDWDLRWGFFFLGLALWNKAVFVWALAGLIVASIAVFWPELRRVVNRRNIVAAAVSFVIGALPFVIYNGHRRAETFRENAHLDLPSIRSKLVHVRNGLGGNGLFGYIVAEEHAPNPKIPQSAKGRIVTSIRDRLGEHRYSGMFYATTISLLVIPLAAFRRFRSRAALFSIIFMVVAWLAMAVTKTAGSSIHHVVLLWPFPQLLVASAISLVPWRPFAVVAGIVLAGMNVLVMNQYLAQFARYGAEGVFTDAIYPLSASLDESPGRTVYALDWGIQDPLDLLHHGQLNIEAAHLPFIKDDPNDWDRRTTDYYLSDRNALFINHVTGRELFAGVTERFNRALASHGCEKEAVRVVADSNGRAVFEVFRVVCRR